MEFFGGVRSEIDAELLAGEGEIRRARSKVRGKLGGSGQGTSKNRSDDVTCSAHWILAVCDLRETLKS